MKYNHSVLSYGNTHALIVHCIPKFNEGYYIPTYKTRCTALLFAAEQGYEELLLRANAYPHDYIIYG